MTIRTSADAFRTDAVAALTEAAAALPALETMFPGSAEAGIAQLTERLELLVSEAENTIAGWIEAVGQAQPNDGTGAAEE